MCENLFMSSRTSEVLAHKALFTVQEVNDFDNIVEVHNYLDYCERFLVMLWVRRICELSDVYQVGLETAA